VTAEDRLPAAPRGVDTATVAQELLANSYKSADPWVDSTGLRTHSLRHRTLSHSNDPRIAEEFLVNTRLRHHDRETEASIQSYFLDAGLATVARIGQVDEPAATKVSLPPSIRLRRDVDEILMGRRSRRQYTGDAIGVDFVATIVRSAAGVTGEATVDLAGGGETTLRFRVAPSGGGLYPVHLYVAAFFVTDLDRQLYRYEPLQDALVRCGGVERLLEACAVSDDLISLRRASVVFLLVGQPWRSLRKYGPRGLRFLFLEAGAMTQNIHIATAALGLGSVDCASFYDDDVHALLRVDGVNEALIHAVVIGDPAD
jgi:SagB-type dehydrogenase family enzyme